jgi:hypothetical protein
MASDIDHLQWSTAGRQNSGLIQKMHGMSVALQNGHFADTVERMRLHRVLRCNIHLRKVSAFVSECDHFVTPVRKAFVTP